MSMNWSLVDLVRRLRKQHITANQVLVGDIVVSDGSCWEVATIHKEPNGFLSILDEDENGYVNVPPHDLYVIVHRGCLGT